MDLRGISTYGSALIYALFSITVLLSFMLPPSLKAPMGAMRNVGFKGIQKRQLLGLYAFKINAV